MPGLQPDLPLFAEANTTDASDRLGAWVPAAWPAATDWQPVLSSFFQSDTGANLGRFVQSRLEAGATVYPPQPLTALALTPLQQVRVVILGQDPYHGPGQAHGLAFSVQPGVRVPPSLRNIFKQIELERQAGALPGVLLGAAAQEGVKSGEPSGCLTPWAAQGVLLLNTCLTVEDGQPAAHAKRGWEALAEQLIEAVLQRREPVVFMLWGAHAQAFAPQIAAHPGAASTLVLQANHPSPLSASRPPVPFLGCGHFGQANAFLRKNGLPEVVW